jgi:hypothetical protein
MMNIVLVILSITSLVIYLDNIAQVCLQHFAGLTIMHKSKYQPKPSVRKISDSKCGYSSPSDTSLLPRSPRSNVRHLFASRRFQRKDGRSRSCMLDIVAARRPHVHLHTLSCRLRSVGNPVEYLARGRVGDRVQQSDHEESRLGS